MGCACRENGSWGHEVERQGDGGEQQQSTLLRNAIPEEEPNASNWIQERREPWNGDRGGALGETAESEEKGKKERHAVKDKRESKRRSSGGRERK